MKSLVRTVAALTFAPAILAGCSLLAVATAPAKQAVRDRTELASRADEVFWSTLHQGRYDDIGKALDLMTAAYLQNPGDAVSAARSGWLHIWRLSEAGRLGGSVPATITDDAVLARKYFEEAHRLDPTEARYRGFVGAARVTEGAIHRDEALIRSGYYAMLDGVDAWPEFNLFTAGYVMALNPVGSKQFAEALEMQWRNADVCIGGKIDRKRPDFAPYMAAATTEGPRRACWNSWIAPHNFEGFMMNMGDMLVKSGDWETARVIYANARLSSTYSSWPYREALEQRIVDAPKNVNAFAASSGRDGGGMMRGSSYGCMACHQER